MPPLTRTRRCSAGLLGLLLMLSGCCLGRQLPVMADRLTNKVQETEPYEATKEGKEFHRTLRVVDLHSDALLFGRDLLSRSRNGHVDVPRLIEGNVWIQCFAAVTKVPMSPSFILGGAGATGISSRAIDLIGLLAMALGYPPQARRGPEAPFHRALHQAALLKEFERRSRGRFRILYTREDLEEYLEFRRQNPGRRVTAGILCIEGAQVLHGKIECLDELFHAGYRMLGLAHFFDTEVGDSKHGTGRNKGLNQDLGVAVVKRMADLGMMLDLAHSSNETVKEILALDSRFPLPPILVSHTGVRALVDTDRNLWDEQISDIARKGGLIGLGLFEGVMGEENMSARFYRRMVRHAADIDGVSVDNLALGSDFDGATACIVDAASLSKITDVLLGLQEDWRFDRGRAFTKEEVAKIMGGNAIRFFLNSLPTRD